MKFRRQHPIATFVADFCSVAHRLLIEIDGPVHAQQREQDDFRQRFLEASGFRVVRFTNEDVEFHLEDVLSVIAAACRAEEAS